MAPDTEADLSRTTPACGIDSRLPQIPAQPVCIGGTAGVRGPSGISPRPTHAGLSAHSGSRRALRTHHLVMLRVFFALKVYLGEGRCR